MARLTGLRSFVVIVVVVFGALRIAHIGVPLVVPEARQGPVAIASLADVRRQAGFAPVLPAYRPLELGERPTEIRLSFSPRLALTVVWQQDGRYLAVTQRRGGARPGVPPLARPFENVPGAVWWSTEARLHLLAPRGDDWIEIETSLSVRDLRRFVDTLTEY